MLLLLRFLSSISFIASDMDDSALFFFVLIENVAFKLRLRYIFAYHTLKKKGVMKVKPHTFVYVAQVALDQSLIDCHVIVYSVVDRPSFNYAEGRLKEVKSQKNKLLPDPIIILVANKQDIVRNRQVPEHGKEYYSGQKSMSSSQIGPVWYVPPIGDDCKRDTRTGPRVCML